MLEDGGIDDISDFLLIRFVGRKVNWVLRCEHLVFVFNVGRGLVIVVNYLHDERYESVHKYVPAYVVVAPYLEQVEQLRCQSAFVMKSPEEL